MDRRADPWWSFLRPRRKLTPTQAALDVHLRVLRRCIDESGWTHAEVRKRTGWCSAYLLEVLSGLRPLQLDELFVVLRVIGVPPRDYFEEVCRELDELEGD